ncbi:hypothetical protein [Methylobacterium sp. ID0610]|uniref:hypothetical protein n=1 Tax=Methylobacterium carpenticola TaxID=3344827 RepID=UPI00369C3E0C
MSDEPYSIRWPDEITGHYKEVGVQAPAATPGAAYLDALSALVDLKDAYHAHLAAVWERADVDDEEEETEVYRTYDAFKSAYRSTLLAVTELLAAKRPDEPQ